MTMINAYDPEARDKLPAEDRALIARREQSLGPAYRLFYEKPVRFVRGEGVWLFDEFGSPYLDAYNNVVSVGHCHPHVVEALARQAATLNTHTRYLSESVVAYAERLLGTFDPALSHAMFTCTGSEANDLAIRIAKAHTGGTGFHRHRAGLSRGDGRGGGHVAVARIARQAWRTCAPRVGAGQLS